MWFKAWCETRVRFVIALVAMAAVAALPGDAASTVYLVLATVLGGGSLRQERAQDTLVFTLALPVPRWRHLAIRAAVAVGEVVAVAGVAAIAVRSPAILARWSPCGVLAMLVSLAFSTLLANEYAAWLAGFGTLMGYEVVTNLLGVDAPDLYRLMASGTAVGLVGLLVVGAGVFALGDRALRWRLP
jgi:hypothetical protein